MIKFDVLLDQFRYVHGDYYDYSRVIYKGTQVPVEIVCRTHGSFMQRPCNHKSGRGCERCNRHRARFSYNKFTCEHVLDVCRRVHCDLYNYSFVKYVNMKTEVSIVCGIHGVFNLTLFKHKNGRGCPSCECELISLIDNLGRCGPCDHNSSEGCINCNSESLAWYDLLKYGIIGLPLAHYRPCCTEDKVGVDCHDPSEEEVISDDHGDEKRDDFEFYKDG